MKKKTENNHKRPLDRHICPLERPTDGPSSPRSPCRHVSFSGLGWQTVLRLREMRLSLQPSSPAQPRCVFCLTLASKEFVIWKIKFFGESTLMSYNEIRYSELLSVFWGYFVYSLPLSLPLFVNTSWVLKKIIRLKTAKESNQLFSVTFDKHLIEAALFGYWILKCPNRVF